MLTNLLDIFKNKNKSPPGLPDQGLSSEKLVPRNRHVDYPKALQAQGVPEQHLPATTPLCGELLVTYAFDLSEQFIMDTPGQLKQAGIAESEVPALALRNLMQLMPMTPQRSRQMVRRNGRWQLFGAH